MMLQYYLIVGAVFGLMLVPVAFSQIQVIQDSEPDPTKYRYIKYIIFYDNKTPKAENDFTAISSERAKYEYREAEFSDIITTGLYKAYSGEMIFKTEGEAELFLTELKTIIQERNVIYALIYHTENTHHYNKPQPDIIIEKIELGEAPSRFD